MDHKLKDEKARKLENKNVGLSDFTSTAGVSTSFLNYPQKGYPEEEKDEEDVTKIGVNNFVIFTYKGKFFPGQVIAINSDDEIFEIRPWWNQDLTGDGLSMTISCFILIPMLTAKSSLHNQEKDELLYRWT